MEKGINGQVAAKTWDGHVRALRTRGAMGELPRT
jgi:hypothetical protein